MQQRMLSIDAFLLVIISTIIIQCNGAPTIYTITLQQYTTIKIGWTQQQVTKLLGGPGDIVSQSGKPGSADQITLVQYSGLKSSTSLAEFTFVGGSLEGKAQTGLDTGIYTITKQQYTAIQIGWTRNQVTNLVGSPGNAVSEAGIGNSAVVLVQYTVPGTTYGVASFGFVAGKVSSKFEVGFDSPVSNKITLRQYQMIQIGWTLRQVTKLLGGPGDIVSQSGIPGSADQLTSVDYYGVQSSTSIAEFTFIGGSLDTKVQTGLDTGIYTITKQQYTAIQIGWTRNQVTNLVGSPGNAVSEAGIGNSAVVLVQYTVPGTTYGVASFGFVAGKVSSKFEVGFDSPVSNKITLRQYQMIQIGWTLRQVTKLLGGPGDIVSQSGIPGSADQLTSVDYYGVQSSTSIAEFTFIGGSLDTKVQTGLDTGIYTITKQQYTAIQIGWTRNQVTNLVGSPGNAVSEAGIGNSAVVLVQYTVPGTTYGVASFGFVAGKVSSKFEVGFDSPVSNKITLRQYQMIQIGWTLRQVTKLLGGPGDIVSQSGIPGSADQLTSVDYYGVQSSTSIAEFTFIGGSLDTKVQTGLDTGIYTITKQQYTAIQIGWTRNQVTNLVGSPGNAVSEAGIGNSAVVLVQYTVPGTTYGVASFGFVAGKVSSKFEVGFDSPVSNKITLRQYQMIQIGWTLRQVTKLLGGPGDIVSQSGIPGSADQLTSVDYYGVQSSTSIAEFTFIGGSLDTKVQTGLDTGIYTITKQQYTAIQIGWTRNQVTNLVGSPGNAVSEAGIGNSAVVLVQYTVPGTTYGVASFGFVAGKVSSKFEVGFDSPVSNKITLRQYQMIQIGWTLRQVTKLLGGPGDIVSQSGIPGSADQLTSVDYYGVQSSTSIAEFTFIGGSLDTKVQTGLDTGIYTITKQQYTAIQIGWTRNQVTNLVGSPGNAVSEAGIGNSAVVLVQYTVPGTTYGVASFGFVAGKVSSKFEVGFDSPVSNKITLRQYQMIQIGWTLRQVTKLLGGPGDIVSQSGIPGSADQLTSVDYYGVQSSTSIAEFTFIGGSLDTKVQTGLDTGIYTITLQQYTTIQIGWTQQQVIQLVGSPGDIVSQSAIPGSADQITLVQYSGVQSSTSIAEFTFIGGSLDIKAQAGLDTRIYTITKQQYTTIQIGWTRKQVTNLVGSPGDTVAETDTGSSAVVLVDYTVAGTTYGSVSFTFVGGKLSDKSIVDSK